MTERLNEIKERVNKNHPRAKEGLFADEFSVSDITWLIEQVEELRELDSVPVISFYRRLQSFVFDEIDKEKDMKKILDKKYNPEELSGRIITEVKQLQAKLEKYEKVVEAAKTYLNYGNISPNHYASTREKIEWKEAQDGLFKSLAELNESESTKC